MSKEIEIKNEHLNRNFEDNPSLYAADRISCELCEKKILIGVSYCKDNVLIVAKIGDRYFENVAHYDLNKNDGWQEK